jgi:TusA-related sulfurtransferase
MLGVQLSLLIEILNDDPIAMKLVRDWEKRKSCVEFAKHRDRYYKDI